MMINKRLIGTVSESKKYIAGNVVAQWCSLAANIVMMYGITALFAAVYNGSYNTDILIRTAIYVAVAAVVRGICTIVSSRMSFMASKTVKKKCQRCKHCIEKLWQICTKICFKLVTAFNCHLYNF